MVTPKTDRRILRTRELIRSTMCELLQQTPASRISVTELCRKAGINRNTFYCHYQTTRDILTEMENEIMALVEDALGDAHDSLEAIILACRIIKENQHICQVLLSENAELDFFPRIMALSEARTKKVMVKKKDPLAPNYQNMISAYMISGSNAVIQMWSRTGMRENPEDIAEFIIELCYRGSSVLSAKPPVKYRKV